MRTNDGAFNVADEGNPAQNAYMDKLFIKRVEDGDRIEYKTNSEFAIGSQVNYQIADGIEGFSSSYFFRKNACSDIMAFRENVIVIYKVCAGRLLFDIGAERQIILKPGDIINYSGNSPVKAIRGFEEMVRIVGVVCYYEKALYSLQEKKWDIREAQEFYNDKIVRNALIYSGDFLLDELIAQLGAAIDQDNRFLIKAKTFEVLYHGITRYRKYVASNRKRYSKYQVEKVNRAREFLDDNLDSYYSMPYLSAKFGISLSRLQDIFKEYYGVSPYKYHLEKRLEKSKTLLLETPFSITDIALGLGFKSSSKFSEAFKKKFGYLPSTLRK